MKEALARRAHVRRGNASCAAAEGRTCTQSRERPCSSGQAGKPSRTASAGEGCAPGGALPPGGTTSAQKLLCAWLGCRGYST